ncbi:MAG TPA: VWA domain-containing protein [Vicinamibacteria bacterium]
MAVSALFVLAASVSVPQAAERPVPEFRTGTRLIRLDVSVVNGRGQPVPDLRPEDFEVREDGRPVAVTYFEALRGDVVRPEDGSAAVAPARRILLLVDAGAMSMGQLRRARESVAGYLRQANAGEWLRLANLSTGEVWDGEMPEDRERLLSAARGLWWQPSPWARGDADVPPIAERVESAPEGGEPSSAATSGQFLSDFAQTVGLLGTLEALLTELEGVDGRKALVLVSPGFPQLGGLDRRLERVATLARQAATAVYFVDAVGQDGLVPDGRWRPAHEMAWERSGGAQDLAVATGGFTSRFANSLLPALSRVAEEMRTYYVLGYAPPGRDDGRFRSVSVKVKVRGLSARTKKGYLALR